MCRGGVMSWLILWKVFKRSCFVEEIESRGDRYDEKTMKWKRMQGDRVLLRTPGRIGKREESWTGSCQQCAFFT